MPRNYIVFGLAGTGKDAFAGIMRKQLKVDTLALADPIREEYVRFTGRYDYKQNRPLMIEIGESYKKIYGQDVWCKQAISRGDFSKGVLIMDGRYAEEYDFFVNKFGFIPILLEADDDIRFERLQKRDGTIQREALEYEKRRFLPETYETLTINTNGTIEQLEEIVRGTFG
ncbi:AAA family ATPase [Bacillus cereus group sp. BceL300]|uniref:AAA family ATPase n=1 Tax=Bacillus cereus group sp. BceL300 TaxID=3444985 RepID=UPI003F290CCB